MEVPDSKGSKMEKYPSLLLSVIFLLLLPGSLWAQCPEDANDLGICDTLYVEAWPHADTCFVGCDFEGQCDTICINQDGESFPCFLYLNLLVTHDSNTFFYEGVQDWTQDSISIFVVPLAYWHPLGGCVDSVVFPTWDGWNSTTASPYNPNIKTSIFRDMIDPLTGDTVFNRMKELGGQSAEWSTIILDAESPACSGDSGYTWLSIIPTVPSNRRWWEGSRVLLATFTFVVYGSQDCDTAEICFDSTFWPPQSHLTFARYDAAKYVPRTNLPRCVLIAGGPTGVRWIESSAEEESRPSGFSVSQNYPNPFNPATEFRFDLPRASRVKIEVFNILGQSVNTLVNEEMKAGSYVVNWDGKDEKGAHVSSGVYFYRMSAGDFSDIKKMVLLR